MQRKLVKQGQSTLMVSLPKRWVDKQGLDKGDRVTIQVDEDSLVIGAGKRAIRRKSIEIDVSGYEPKNIRLALVNAYRLGYSDITVTYDDIKEYAELQRLTGTLLGLEIVSHEGNRCVLESIAEVNADQLDNIMRKLFYSVRELLDHAIAGETDPAFIDPLEHRIQRYESYTRRVSSMFDSSDKPASLLWQFLSGLNHAQREVYHAMKQAPEVSDRMSSLLNDIKRMTQFLYEAYFANQQSAVAELLALQKKIFGEKARLLLEDDEVVAMQRLMTAVRMLSLASSPLVSLHLLASD